MLDTSAFGLTCALRLLDAFDVLLYDNECLVEIAIKLPSRLLETVTMVEYRQGVRYSRSVAKRALALCPYRFEYLNSSGVTKFWYCNANQTSFAT